MTIKMMLFVRYPDRTRCLLLNDDGVVKPTLGYLKEIARLEIGVHAVKLGLTAEDSLDGPDDTPLIDLGIEGGSLLHGTPIDTPPAQAAPGGRRRRYMLRAFTEGMPCFETRVASSRDDHLGMETDEPALPPDQPAERWKQPLLISDIGQNVVPGTLHSAVASMDGGLRGPPEVIFAACHVVMWEAGYQIEPEKPDEDIPADELELTAGYLPNSWRRAGFYLIKYIHPACPGINFKLSAEMRSKKLVVVGTAAGEETAVECTFSVVPGDVVKDFELYQENVDVVFQNVAGMAGRFRREVCNAIFDQAREGAAELPVDLSTLPTAVKVLILSKLDYRDLLNMGMVDKEWNAATNEPFLWRRLYLRHFGVRYDSSFNQNWRQFVLDKFEAGRKLTRRALPHFDPQPVREPKVNRNLPGASLRGAQSRRGPGFRQRDMDPFFHGFPGMGSRGRGSRHHRHGPMGMMEGMMDMDDGPMHPMEMYGMMDPEEMFAMGPRAAMFHGMGGARGRGRGSRDMAMMMGMGRPGRF